MPIIKNIALLLLLLSLISCSGGESRILSKDDLGVAIETTRDRIYAITIDVKGASDCPSKIMIYQDSSDEWPDVYSVRSDTSITLDWYHGSTIIDTDNRRCIDKAIELRCTFHSGKIFNIF